jgi:hypothetical protein
MWGVRCALDTGVARALGLTTVELEALLGTRSLAQIAADRGVPMPGLRQLAWTIAEPQLAAAVAAGVIDDHERTALHRTIEEKRGPWSDLASSRIVPAHPHGSSVSSVVSSSGRRAQALVGSEAGKVSSSSSSSLASSSGVRGRSSVTRASRTRS